MPELNMDFVERAADLFRQKTAMTRDQFDALSYEMKARAFTVSYVESVDQVKAIQDVLERAIREGSTLSQFRRNVSDHIRSHPWHVETVFRTNIQSAFGAAKWERAQKLKSLRPYGRYSAVMDGRTRPEHAKLHGLVYPLDHPFWKTYWPPWDYNCRCHVKTMTQYEVERGNVEVETAMPDVVKSNDFTSPASAGVGINPSELLNKRMFDVPADVAIAARGGLEAGLMGYAGARKQEQLPEIKWDLEG